MITVIGSANVDYVIHTSRMPLMGETIVGDDFQVNAGGKGLNQAVAIAKLGGDAAFFGMLGDDEGGRLLESTLRDNGVRFVGKRVSAHTGAAMITVAKGDNAIILHPGANDRLIPAVLREQETLIAQSEFVVMQLEIPVESVMAVCETAGKYGTKIVLNPAPFKELPAAVLAAVEWVIPNEHEARLLTGISVVDVPSAKQAAVCLKSMGVRNTVITLGGNGCVYTDGDEVYHCPAKPTSVVDTTSAGDCFIGAFVTRLSKGDTVAQAVDFATVAASITVSRKGASCSIPHISELI